MSLSAMPNAEAVLTPADDMLYEVVDDQVVELGPMGAHEIWLATELVVHLMNFAKQHQLGRAVQEMLFDFTAMVQRKRRPDAAFVSYERWPQQRRVPHAEAWEVVPNLAVEVLSPSDKGDDILDKVAGYFRIGVECILGHLYFPRAGLYLRVTHPGTHPHPRGRTVWRTSFAAFPALPGHPVRGRRGGRVATIDDIVGTHVHL